MALTSRQRRPLDKDTQQFRDDRIFIIASDDTYAPKQYFDFFKISRIQIHVVQTVDGTSSAEHVLERLLSLDFNEGDERWLILDTDHYTSGNHLKSFRRAIKKAKDNNVHVILSKPCFELWLLLYHREENEALKLNDAKSVELSLREVIGEYNKTKLKRDHYQAKNLLEAFQRAEKLEKNAGGKKIPKNNSSQVFKIFKSLLKKARPTDISHDLLDLHKYITRR